jgi:hypothetical protein
MRLSVFTKSDDKLSHCIVAGKKTQKYGWQAGEKLRMQIKAKTFNNTMITNVSIAQI